MTRGSYERITPSLLDRPTSQTARIAQVAIIKGGKKAFSFVVPPELGVRLQAGMRVEVPYGRKDKVREGFCLEVSEKDWKASLKPVLGILDEAPLLSGPLLELGHWIARYYAAPLGRTLSLMIPPSAKRQSGAKRLPYVALAEESFSCDPGAPEAHGGRKLTAKQKAVIEILKAHGAPMRARELQGQVSCGPTVIKTLEKAGWVRIEARREQQPPSLPDVPRWEPDFELNADQQAAVERMTAAVRERRFGVQVLFGVTGSGKTECYVAAVRQALADGRQAIILVPEIALATQTVRRLHARFDKVAVLHSHLSEVQRARMWAAIGRGELPVVIGTRSAVFAPCPSLGLIVVDEEGETSYKNQSAPRYHTRDVAVMRGHFEKIPIVLGSATPSLETWHNVQTREHYELLRLPQRVRGLALPAMQLVDLREEPRTRSGQHLISGAMEGSLRRTLERGEQSVLLLNRRGYAAYLVCPKCKTVITCPRCSVRMVFHRDTGHALCHYCQSQMEAPTACPMLGCGTRLEKMGMGAQRLEDELRELLPQARIHRVDSDVMNEWEAYARVLEAFERREIDILLGTQMLAKGLDFPFVAFVGVVNADTALAIHDFRAAERTFQLVTQVAGRSGRGATAGTVVVQSFLADSDPIRLAMAGDYERFAELELAERRRVELPPITRMVRIVLFDRRVSHVEAQAAELRRRIETALAAHGLAARVVGPQPAQIARIRDEYRFELQLIFAKGTALLAATDLFRSEGTLRIGVGRVEVDVDPVNLL